MIKKLLVLCACISLSLVLSGCSAAHKGMVEDVVKECQTETKDVQVEVTGYLRISNATINDGEIRLMLSGSEGTNKFAFIVLNTDSKQTQYEINKRGSSKPVTFKGTLDAHLTSDTSIRLEDAQLVG